MDIFDLAPFILTAMAIGFIYIKRSRSKERQYTPYDITPIETREIFFDESPEQFKERIKKLLADQGITVHSEKGNKILFDSQKIGAFHWGFLYTLEVSLQGEGTQAVFGIFGKGPNPPRRKTQGHYLDEFINSRILQ